MSRRRDRAMAGLLIPPNIQASLSACRLRSLAGEGVTDAEARRVATVPHPCLAASPRRDRREAQRSRLNRRRPLAWRERWKFCARANPTQPTSLAPDQRREQINLAALRERRKEGTTVDRAVDGNRDATVEDRPQLRIELAQPCEQLADGCRFYLELGCAAGLRHERAAEPYPQHAARLTCSFMPDLGAPSIPPRRCGSWPLRPRRSPVVPAAATSA